jgi:hypothetical protein
MLSPVKMCLSKTSKCLNGRELYFLFYFASEAHFSYDSPRFSVFSIPFPRGA